MRIIILVLCCVCGNYGDNSTERPEKSNIVVTFNVSVTGENAWCRSSKKELTLEEGSTVLLNASSPIHTRDGTDKIRKIKCTFNNGTGNYELGEAYDRQQKNGDDWQEKHTVSKNMFGTWTCKLKYNQNAHLGEIQPIEQDRTYSYVVCNITVKKPDVSTTTVATPAIPEMPMNSRMWYIIGGVGIVVLLIIIGQTIALCYFRRKAQPRRTMDNLTTRSRFDRSDRVRYSAPPCKKGKSSARAQADTDSHIYEMVGVNALYNKSSDLDPEANTATAERTIRDRPPLPLPHEIPKPVLLSATETLPRHKVSPMTSMSSTLSLNSASSGSNLISSNKKGKELPPPPGQGFRKAPARPPKQIDEDSIPGSLRRPAMPLPAPASASVKTSALPKKPSTESPMSELKNIFKKRNARTDTSKSSPAATLERKEPPKVQAKPSTLTKSPKKQPPDATTIPGPHTYTPAVKPINQTNQIKLILPKIEASLKAPKPLIPKPVEPTTSPIKSPPKPMKKPSQVQQKPMPLPVTQLAPIPVQKRPLPTPETSRKLPPEPISPQPMPPLPPIYQESHEGLFQDDDEEWTYEQLEEYNIYNI